MRKVKLTTDRTQSERIVHKILNEEIKRRRSNGESNLIIRKIILYLNLTSGNRPVAAGSTSLTDKIARRDSEWIANTPR